MLPQVVALEGRALLTAPIVHTNLSLVIPITLGHLIIRGENFDTTAANNTVTFNLGAVGTVTSYQDLGDHEELNVTFTTQPTTAGSLTAVVTTPGGSNFFPVQVAQVRPVVRRSDRTYVPGRPDYSLSIAGFGFDPTAANNTVTFNLGAVGTLTNFQAGDGDFEQLDVTFTTEPSAGILTAVVTTNGVPGGDISGFPEEVATVVDNVVVRPGNGLTLPYNTSFIPISGSGFDPTAANNTVTFNLGAAGTVTSFQDFGDVEGLFVTLTTPPTSVGSLTAVVTNTSSGVTSIEPVEVAILRPVVFSGSQERVFGMSTTVNISGAGFDPTAANNTVAFNLGAVGTVTSVEDGFLTVTFTTLPTSAGILTAVVTTTGISSGDPVQVANVVAALESIAVLPASPSIGAGTTQQFMAIGSYNDGSTQDLTGSVTWESATPSVATITADGLATGVAAGTSLISARVPGPGPDMITGSTTLTVTGGVATVSPTVGVTWGTSGAATLETAPDGLRLLPTGRSTDAPWMGLNRLVITLTQSAGLAPGDVTVVGARGVNYGPVTITGEGTNYVITLARAITDADRVNVIIHSPTIETFTRRLDVLPGDFNDDGVVTASDLVGLYAATVGPYNVFGDLNGDGFVNLADIQILRRKVGTRLP